MNEKLLIDLIQKGFFHRKRKPYVIPVYSLTQAFKKVSKHKLAKEVAYVLSTETYYRLAYEERYRLAFNTVVLNSWDNIAVVQLTNKLNTFSNIICINLEEYNDSFKLKNQVFIKLVLSELNIIRRS